MTVAVAGNAAGLGPEWDAVFATGPGLQSRRLWFEATEAAALPAGARPHYVALRHQGAPWALLPMQAGPGRRMISLTSPYTVLFQPLLTGRAAQAGEAFGRHLRSWPVTLIEALDPAWPELAAFVAGLRRAGLVVAGFDQFGNWVEPIAGLDWAAYLGSRPGALRETIRRKGRAAAKAGTVRFEVTSGLEGLEAGLAAYEAVYARSWKVPEPFPRYNAELLRRAAAVGAMRLGVMWQGDVPLAAQYWTVGDGVATVLKLAHDEAARTLSPGTLLTAHMIRLLIEEGGVGMLDFGRGDDAYKQHWAGTRRPRIGLLVATPWRAGGLLALGRHLAGGVLRAVRG